MTILTLDLNNSEEHFHHIYIYRRWVFPGGLAAGHTRYSYLHFHTCITCHVRITVHLPKQLTSAIAQARMGYTALTTNFVFSQEGPMDINMLTPAPSRKSFVTQVLKHATSPSLWPSSAVEALAGFPVSLVVYSLDKWINHTRTYTHTDYSLSSPNGCPVLTNVRCGRLTLSICYDSGLK